MRLIDADKLIKLFDERAITLKGVIGDLGGACSGASKLIKEQPTVHPESPKMGKWIPFGSLDLDGNQQYNCSLCHCLEVHTPAAKVSYCWNCGAKMEVDYGTAD